MENVFNRPNKRFHTHFNTNFEFFVKSSTKKLKVCQRIKLQIIVQKRKQSAKKIHVIGKKKKCKSSTKKVSQRPKKWKPSNRKMHLELLQKL